MKACSPSLVVVVAVVVHKLLVVHTWLEVVGEEDKRLVVEVVGVQQHNMLGQQLDTEQGMHRLVQLA